MYTTKQNKAQGTIDTTWKFILDSKVWSYWSIIIIIKQPEIIMMTHWYLLLLSIVMLPFALDPFLRPSRFSRAFNSNKKEKYLHLLCACVFDWHTILCIWMSTCFEYKTNFHISSQKYASKLQKSLISNESSEQMVLLFCWQANLCGTHTNIYLV